MGFIKDQNQKIHMLDVPSAAPESLPKPPNTATDNERLQRLGKLIDDALDAVNPTISNALNAKKPCNNAIDNEGDIAIYGDAITCLPDPTPIDPSRIQIVQELKLGSTWTQDDSNMGILRRIFSPTSSEDTVATDCRFDSHLAPVECGSAARTSPLVLPRPGDGRDDYLNLWNSESSTAHCKKEKWNERFEELCRYLQKHGHCVVPHNFEENRSLAHWVKRQRYQLRLKVQGKRTTLTEERIKKLDRIGFVWSFQSTNWEGKFVELANFASRHGHCNVPSRYPPNRQLSTWVRCQRRQYKLYKDGDETSNMTKDRIAKLASIGFVFCPRKVMGKPN